MAVIDTPTSGQMLAAADALRRSLAADGIQIPVDAAVSATEVVAQKLRTGRPTRLGRFDQSWTPRDEDLTWVDDMAALYDQDGA